MHLKNSIGQVRHRQGQKDSKTGVRIMHLCLTLSPGKAISGFEVMVILASACAALILPTSVLSDASGNNACMIIKMF